MAPPAATTAANNSPPHPLDATTVIEVAGELVDQIGPEALSLSGIARELGVTQPALYRHVDDLASLWRGLGLATRALLADHLADAAVGLSGPEAMKAVAGAWRQFARRHPGRYRSTDRYAVAGDADLEQAANRTVGVLEKALRGFDLPDHERRHAAHSLRSALHGFVMYELSDGHPDPDHLDTSFDRMVEHLSTAFAAIDR
ncbi:MAG: WHG domain-containing protein [Actinomycetota bacterium]